MVNEKECVRRLNLACTAQRNVYASTRPSTFSAPCIISTLNKIGKKNHRNRAN